MKTDQTELSGHLTRQAAASTASAAVTSVLFPVRPRPGWTGARRLERTGFESRRANAAAAAPWHHQDAQIIQVGTMIEVGGPTEHERHQACEYRTAAGQREFHATQSGVHSFSSFPRNVQPRIRLHLTFFMGALHSDCLPSLLPEAKQRTVLDAVRLQARTGSGTKAFASG